MNCFRADLYKMIKEKSFVVPTFISILAGGLFSYFMRNSKGDEGLVTIASSLSGFVPLFFTSVATVFWAEPYTSRTINTMIIKSKSRFSLFLYKTFMSLLFSVLFIMLIFISITITRICTVGNINLNLLIHLAWYQLPYYLYSIFLLIFIFNYFDKAYQAYISYIVFVLLFDNLLSYITSNILKTDFFNQFYLFNQLKMITGTGEYLTNSTIIALVFSIVYFLITYYLFNTREFK